MKARNMLWVSMINIFLILLVSIMMEYSDLNSRFKQLQSVVSTATDMAIRTSTASEELFSEEYKRETTSSHGAGVTESTSPSTLKVLSSDGKSWVEGKTYVMAKFYQERGRFPNTSLEYSSYERSNSTDEDIYRWLFGNIGSVYNKMGWANNKTKLWNSFVWNGVSSSRTPTTNFMNFYNSIGRYITTDTYVKVRTGSSYDIAQVTLPTLTQMGLSLDTYYNGNESGSSSITNDFLSSVVHFGKAGNGIADTSYYLTPYSLGVTYIPVEVLKPSFLSYTEQLVRFNKVKHTVTSNGDLQDFASANGCIETEVYDNGNHAQHKSSNGEKIINDGEIEYDLSSAKVKVDYFLVDFYNNSNWEIVNRIEGSTTQYSGDRRSVTSRNQLTTLPERLRNKDTSETKSGKRIVAKVSVKMKVHIPYKSAILQWFRHINGDSRNNHYDIRLWNETGNGIEANSNGVWFYYTTYTAITR